MSSSTKETEAAKALVSVSLPPPMRKAMAEFTDKFLGIPKGLAPLMVEEKQNKIQKRKYIDSDSDDDNDDLIGGDDDDEDDTDVVVTTKRQRVVSRIKPKTTVYVPYTPKQGDIEVLALDAYNSTLFSFKVDPLCKYLCWRAATGGPTLRLQEPREDGSYVYVVKFKQSVAKKICHFVNVASISIEIGRSTLQSVPLSSLKHVLFDGHRRPPSLSLTKPYIVYHPTPSLATPWNTEDLKEKYQSLDMSLTSDESDDSSVDCEAVMTKMHEEFAAVRAELSQPPPPPKAIDNVRETNTNMPIQTAVAAAAAAAARTAPPPLLSSLDYVPRSLLVPPKKSVTFDVLPTSQAEKTNNNVIRPSQVYAPPAPVAAAPPPLPPPIVDIKPLWKKQAEEFNRVLDEQFCSAKKSQSAVIETPDVALLGGHLRLLAMRIDSLKSLHAILGLEIATLQSTHDVGETKCAAVFEKLRFKD